MRVIYQAFDGRIFPNEKLAKEWEKKYEGIKFYNFAHNPHQPLVFLPRDPRDYVFEDSLCTEFRWILEDGQMCNLIIVRDKIAAGIVATYWDEEFSIDLPNGYLGGEGAYVRVYDKWEWTWMKYEDYKEKFGTDSELEAKIKEIMNDSE